MSTSSSAKQHQTSESAESQKQSDNSTAKASSEQQQRSNVFEKIKEQMPRSRSGSPNPPAVNTKCTNMTDQKPAQVERKPSSPTSPTATHPKPPTKRHSSGTFNDCGRHSNDWLFNGFSVTEAAKGLLKRRDS
jgi:hypothetical protein